MQCVLGVSGQELTLPISSRTQPHGEQMILALYMPYHTLDVCVCVFLEQSSCLFLYRIGCSQNNYPRSFNRGVENWESLARVRQSRNLWTCILSNSCGNFRQNWKKFKSFGLPPPAPTSFLKFLFLGYSGQRLTSSEMAKGRQQAGKVAANG